MESKTADLSLREGDDDRDEVEILADDYIARRRRGERPDVEEYALKLPDRAEEVRELFPAIAAMERWKPQATPSPRNSSPRLASIPDRLGDYRIIREIGRGGMGVVFEAEQESLARRVAIKILPGLSWVDDRPMKRFLREAKTAASLQHGHIVPVFDAGQDQGLHYYVMPLIAGVGLDRVLVELRRASEIPPSAEALTLADPARASDAGSIARSLLDGPIGGSNPQPEPGSKSMATARLPDAESGYWKGVARVGAQVARALHHAHEQGVLHRDVKPANLLVDAEGVAWVLDFGLAKAMASDDLSRTGDLVGTLRYMAPERFHGRCDARSDVYSLGLTLVELLTLQPAREGSDGMPPGVETLGKGQARSKGRNPSIPVDLESVVLKAIEAEPDRRYPSAAAMADDLDRFLDGKAVLARRADLVERLARWVEQNPLVAALSATSIVLALVASFFIRHFFFPPFPPPPRFDQARPGSLDRRPDRPPPPPRPPWPPPPRDRLPPPPPYDPPP